MIEKKGGSTEREKKISGRTLSGGLSESQTVLKGEISGRTLFGGLSESQTVLKGEISGRTLSGGLSESQTVLLLLLRGTSLTAEFSWPRFRGRTHSADSQKRYRDRRPP